MNARLEAAARALHDIDINGGCAYTVNDETNEVCPHCLYDAVRILAAADAHDTTEYGTQGGNGVITPVTLRQAARAARKGHGERVERRVSPWVSVTEGNPE